MVTFSTKQLHEKASKAEVSLHEVPLALETSYWRGSYTLIPLISWIYLTVFFICTVILLVSFANQGI
ncbi:hypothetical protein Syun_022477 [Stephania yunnanensis]|uniref:Uncharacterized protein n=1 Tax=Stephania yunnanensis TaxID=152371 RepID=A0AAP0F818_9MAGN